MFVTLLPSCGLLPGKIPPEMVARIVELKIRWQEALLLHRAGQIDDATLNYRRSSIEYKIGNVSMDMQRLPVRVQAHDIESQVNPRLKWRLWLLQLRWRGKEKQYLNEARRGHRVDIDQLMKDAALAFEPKGQRLELEDARERGYITITEFAARERELPAERSDLRAKYERQGSVYAAHFDREVEAMAQDLQYNHWLVPMPGKSWPEPPQSPTRTILYVAGGACVLLIVMGLLRRTAKAPPKRSTVYGSAHYAPLEAEVIDKHCVFTGVFFGKSSQPRPEPAPLDASGAPICSLREHHSLIVARTRTGKGTRVIVPTLLRYAGSALVIDPKGENAAITARPRRDQLRNEIHLLNPWSQLADVYGARGLAAATYNPLDILDRNDPNAVAVAQMLAGVICPAPANAKDKFWQGNAANVLTAVLLWLADQPGEQKTLARARQIVTLRKKEFEDKFLTRMAASEAFSGAICEMAAPFLGLADETYSGIMANLAENTKFLSDPQIKTATSASSFSMQDLAARKVTAYVVIPPERIEMQRTWLRLLVTAATHTFKHLKPEQRGRHRCLFLIDEFAALGRLDDLPRDIATMSGFGVDYALVVQGLDQLKDHYDDAQGTILSNCAYKWFCNVNDLESGKYVSETLGKATVETISTSDSVSTGGHGSTGHSTTRAETGRPLLMPDEVLTLGKDTAILFNPKGHPHYLRTVDYWNLAGAFSAVRETNPELYWDVPLVYDENPYVGGRGNGDATARAIGAEPEAGPTKTRRWWRRPSASTAERVEDKPSAHTGD